MKPGNQHDSFACKVPIPADICLRDKDAFIVLSMAAPLQVQSFFIFFRKDLIK